MEVVLSQNGTAMTLSLCRDYHMGGTQSTISPLRRMKSCQHDEESQIKKLSNSMFEHMVAEAFHKMRKEIVLELQRKVP